ncbi:MAG: type I DNA topoisomerase [Planctomycetota bacterium]|nr:MAG: type I DNA topoisomerase [Planctomycetota bacterium]
MSDKSSSKKTLVIVESPAKAKKIGGFLGRNFDVRASVGHIRDLPQKAADVSKEMKEAGWDALGVNVAQDFTPLYIVPSEKKKLISELKKALKEADELILATDEDREGESIGWHLADLLQPKVPVKRMTFSEITKEAILDALKHTRDLDMNLVRAQETRRVLDRLYGYTLSPLLWKKVAPKLSAGRVQSVAVRVLVQRELERLAFVSGTYWDIKAYVTSPSGTPFVSELATVGGKRVAAGKDFDENTGHLKSAIKDSVVLLDETLAKAVQNRVKSSPWTVTSVESKPSVRRPYAPFTTSSLQQDANNKLRLSARETMQVAQRLYEDGYITYMRTDSVHLSQEAMTAARTRIAETYGTDYLSPTPRTFTSKTKNAQEAHEAIRPAGKEMLTGEQLGLSGRELALYDLIWKRTMACQMADARLRQEAATIQAADAEFRATGQVVEFPGFFRAYVEGADDPEAALEDRDNGLPPLKERDAIGLEKLEPLGHETKPPARYTEATLVKKLEAEGVGRPSTYASIISTVQDRGYVTKASNQLIPTFKAFAVSRLLEEYFPKLVDLQFTAQMEQSLDDISNGVQEYLPYLKDFYLGENGLEAVVKHQEANIDPRKACTVEIKGLNASVRIGRYGPYLQRMDGEVTLTAPLPDDVSPADINNELADKLFEAKQRGPEALGMHPDEGVPVFSLTGRFGPYVQLGEVTDENPKPKRASIPRGTDPASVSLDMAIQLLTLPRNLGPHPEDGKPVNAGIGRFGPYVEHNRKFKSLQKTDDVLTIQLPRGLELLAMARAKSGPAPLRELGKHPEDGETVAIYDGKYGYYVKHGDVNATIPKDANVEAYTLEEALPLLADRAAAGGGKSARKKVTKKAAPKKKAAAKKKAVKKKTATKKVAE